MRKLTLLFVFLLGISTLHAQESAKAFNAGADKVGAKNFAGAVTDFKKAIEEAKKEGEKQEIIGKYTYYLGFASYKSKAYTKAITHLTEAVKLNAETENAYKYLAKANTKLYKVNGKNKKHAEAIKYAKAAIEYSKLAKDNKSLANGYYYAGTFSYKTDDCTNAIAYLDSSVTNNKNKENCYYYISNCYKKQKDNENYLKTLEKGVGEFPESKKLNQSYGLYMYGEGANSLTEAKKKASNPVAYKKSLLEAKSKLEKAVPILEKAKSKGAQKALDAIKTYLKDISAAVAAIK